MSFNTLDFFLLFAVTVLLYFVLPRKLKNPVLLLSNLVFYAVYDWILILYLILTTLAAWGFGLLIEKGRGRKSGKAFMIAGVLSNVLVLVFYKYFNFLSANVGSLLGVKEPVRLSLVVPLGISFIVFTAISYIVDVYKEKTPAEKNLFRFSLYMTFFPKIVQGPIEKAGDMLPQFDQPHRFDLLRFRKGMLWVLYGLFMKMVVADTAAIAVDTVYGNLTEYSGAAVLFATVLFAVQLYADFAGYSYTALGAAMVLGFDLKQNFRQPYLSLSVSEFWRRWHMSLNVWLRDYIYIPLGGNRCSKARKNFNTLATFAVSGIWHGADWGYLIWGLLNGLYVIAEGFLKGLSGKDKEKKEKVPAHSEKQEPSRLAKMGKGLLTTILVGFSWIFFRGRDLGTSFTVIRTIFSKFHLIEFMKYIYHGLRNGSTVFGLDARYGLAVLALGILTVILVDLYENRHDLAGKLAGGNRAIRWTVCFLLIFAIMLFGVYGYGYSASSFIYTGF